MNLIADGTRLGRSPLLSAPSKTKVHVPGGTGHLCFRGGSAVISGWHVLEGWSGEIYVGFDGWEDPKLKAWSGEFEINGTWSKYPEKFALLAIPYRDWVENGGIEKHEAYLKELEDPDSCP